MSSTFSVRARPGIIKGYLELYDDQSGYKTQGQEDNTKVKLTSVKDAQRTLAICKKITVASRKNKRLLY
ncbi:MAG: hypothetical protein WDO15_23450 [Bacteroidota bacterium]